MTRKEVIQIRVSAEEKAGIEARAKRAGLKVSVWLRSVALRDQGIIALPPKRNPALPRVREPTANLGAHGSLAPPKTYSSPAQLRAARNKG